MIWLLLAILILCGLALWAVIDFERKHPEEIEPPLGKERLGR